MEHLCLTTTSPQFNLALEETLFRTLPENHAGWFLLWQNSPSVIVGRYQVTENEIDRDFLKQEKIPAIRRITGGGAVYHDSGNLNYSFIHNLEKGQAASFKPYLSSVRKALSSLGVNVEISGRNDLEAEGKKISGSSQLRSGQKILHHGTLLINADFSKLSRALRPGQKKTARHGAQSVRSRVGNLADFWGRDNNIATLKGALLESCAPKPGILEKDIEEIATNLATLKYGQWEWNYGAMEKYNICRKSSFAWGEIAVYALVRDKIIETCRITGDFFSNRDISWLEENLAGKNVNELPRCLTDMDWQDFFCGCDPGDMRAFFTSIGNEIR